MILGLGIDIVEVSRLEKWLKDNKLLQRFFSEEEIEYVLSKENGAARSLAVRFAAKEAYGKALGTGLKGITLKNILVTNNPNGKPELTLFGDAAIQFKRIHGTHIHLSLTHESNMAIAGVILES